mmetsp:Transcript_8407/g.14179  ORF Transcript_8407/g.14179 Transcript_8407/m.14179 type:complete len:204 (-) Transcript_8407:147-758(-)
MTISTTSEMIAHAAYANQATAPERYGLRPILSPVLTRIMSLKSSASCECARERAHSRRYEAVFEMAPSTNSIVWIAWWMNESPKENSSPSCPPCPPPPAAGSGSSPSSSVSYDFFSAALCSASSMKGMGKSRKGTATKEAMSSDIWIDDCISEKQILNSGSTLSRSGWIGGALHVVEHAFWIDGCEQAPSAYAIEQSVKHWWP